MTQRVEFDGFAPMRGDRDMAATDGCMQPPGLVVRRLRCLARFASVSRFR